MDATAKAVADRVVGDRAKEILSRFSLKGLKEAGGEETRRFETKLLLDGKVVATVSNGGTGGSNSYHWTDLTLRSVTEELAKEWDSRIKGHGFEVLGEVVEALIVRGENEKAKKKWAKKGYAVVALVHVGEKTLRFRNGNELPTGGKHYEVAAVTEADLQKLLAEKYAGARVEFL